MKNYVLILLLIISFSCKKKDAIETINYDSEIFSGFDTLIYGKWDYLYTYSGDYVLSKSDLNLPSLSFTHIANYEKLQEGNILENGKIIVLSNSSNITSSKGYLVVSLQFCPNGISNSKAYVQSLSFSNSGTLTINSGWTSHYFNRTN
jgi:hypothetical protein